MLALFHFSPPVFSSALAMAEATGANGKDLLTALAAGCEVMERVSMAANNDLRNRAFHTTPTCGVFGATVAAGKLLQLTPEQLTSAFGLAGAQASGLMEMYGPSMQKRFNPGPAARNGVTSAMMAKLGFTGADTIFEGELEIRRKHAPDLSRIRSIVVRRHPDWSHYHRNIAPRTYHEAQVSLPYSVAIALLEGNALLAQYTDRKLGNATVRRLMDRTRIDTDAKLPRGVSCHTTITMQSGEKYVSQVDYPKGSIQNPMSDEELRVKFELLSVPVVGATKAEKIADLVMHIERCSDVGELLRLTVPAPRKSKKKKAPRRH